MSHLFVSYNHVDKLHLDRLIDWLRSNDFAENEVWFDRQIGGGNNWRDEITSALNEAFAVLVVVTANSVTSLYCTFEWAYAMGQGIPILPLVFGELNIADVPTPLTSKQFTNCTDSIPGYLQEQIQRLKSVPPQVAAINQMVFDAIYDTHRRFFVLGWLGDGLRAFDDEYRESIVTDFSRQAMKAHQTLQSLMMDKAFALSGKQYRLCWKLTDFLGEFSELPYKSETHLQQWLFPCFESEWLPAVEYFANDSWWQKWIRRYFEGDLEHEHTKMQVFAEMARVFPDLDPSDFDILIHNKTLDQKRSLR